MLDSGGRKGSKRLHPDPMRHAIIDKDRDRGGLKDNSAGQHTASEETGGHGLLGLPRGFTPTPCEPLVQHLPSTGTLLSFRLMPGGPHGLSAKWEE